VLKGEKTWVLLGPKTVSKESHQLHWNVTDPSRGKKDKTSTNVFPQKSEVRGGLGDDLFAPWRKFLMHSSKRGWRRSTGSGPGQATVLEQSGWLQWADVDGKQFSPEACSLAGSWLCRDQLWHGLLVNGTPGWEWPGRQVLLSQ